jgi:hypothetical protein
MPLSARTQHERKSPFLRNQSSGVRMVNSITENWPLQPEANEYVTLSTDNQQ